MIPREKNYVSNKLDKLSAIQDSMSAGVNSAPRPYGGQLSEKIRTFQTWKRLERLSNVVSLKEHSNGITTTRRFRDQTRRHGSRRKRLLMYLCHSPKTLLVGRKL